MSSCEFDQVGLSQQIYASWLHVSPDFALSQVLHPANLSRDITEVELLQIFHSLQEQDPNLTTALKNWHTDRKSPFIQFLEFNDYPQIKLAFEVLGSVLYPE